MIGVWREGDTLVLRLYIQPRASRDHIAGAHGDEIKVAITAPPVDGQANSHLIRFLAKEFGVAKSRVILEKGELGRHKQIRIDQPRQIPEPIARLLDAA
ncbi:DUF167 family protein YggU [Sodalis sp. (in: enterobacteria)]|uniref:DUF167 family protein YggU n=1 Tax=Sodalis sp. (in: enterobacteria) TaxID=1898979 RepID=UPI003F3F48BB